LIEHKQNSTDENALGRVKPEAFLVFYGLHVLLAVVIRSVPILATIFALGMLGVGLTIVLLKDIKINSIYIISYLVGVELFWRMTDANVFYETGKYGVSFLAILALLAAARDQDWRMPKSPVLYFILLVPSTIFTFSSFDLDLARQYVSFNLSGPLALTICAIYFSRMKIDLTQLKKMVLVIIAPIISVATHVGLSTLSRGIILFRNESNFSTSGGFGPNQVSSVFGLGVLLIFVYLLLEKENRIFKLLLVLLMLTFITQGLLTFSRGGIYLATIAISLAFLVTIREPKKFVGSLLLIIVLSAVFYWLLVPWLEEFTGGFFVTRFTDFSLTNRPEIALADIQTWLDNFWFGVGPGGSYGSRLVNLNVSAHTEFTRMLADHGMMGAISILLLLIFSIRNWLKCKDPVLFGVVTALVIWSMGYLLLNAMRLVAPSFFLGLIFSSVLTLKNPDIEEQLLASS